MQMKVFNKSFWKIRKKRKSYAVTSKPTMISSDGRKTPIKMAGYLEKKSKMRVVCRWKKLWFVLEGRLLLYYKSQIEYLSLSPCRGTVNMGLAASVIPGKSNEIIVSTRSTTVSLRALNRGDHDVWLQALMDAMCMPNHAGSCKKPVHHFRYSTGVLDQADIKTDVPCSGANNEVEPLSPLYMKTSSNVNVSVSPVAVKSKPAVINEPELVQEHTPTEIQRKNTTQNGLNRIPANHPDNKVDRLGKKFSKVAVSDTSIPGKFKLTSNENVKTSLRRSASVEEEVNRYSENIYESLKDVNKFESNIINKQTRKFVNRVNRSDSDCLMMIAREKSNKVQSSPFRSEQRIMTSGNSPLPVYDRYGESFYFRRPEKQNLNEKDKLWRLKQKYNHANGHNYVKEIKSDTDLSVRKHRYILDEPKHYGALCKPTALTKRNSESYDFSNLQEIVKDKTRGPLPIPINPASLRQTNKPTRSNSILRNFSRLKQNDKNNSTSSDMSKRNSVKKKSLSFLRKMWKRKDDSSKWEIDSFSSELNIQFQEMQGPSSDFDNISDFSVNDASIAYDVPLPEPPPDYDQVQVIDDESDQADEPPALPPRLHHIRAASPQHDRPINNKPIVNIEPEAPALPVKMRNKLHQQNNHAKLDYLFYENTDPGLRYLFQEEEYLINQENGKENHTIINNVNNNNNNNEEDLGEMLIKLNEINKAPLTGFHLYENGQNSFGVRKGKHDEDPDYDVPRPHVSLLSNLRKESCVADLLPATNFFNQYEDSLDVNMMRDRFEDFTMAPDSLECDPWSLSNEAEVRSSENWSLSCDLHESMKSISDHNLNHDSLYHPDSLNPPAITHRLSDYIHLQQNGFIQLHS